MNIGILGLGAIGTVFAANLSDQKDVELCLFSRTAKNRIQLNTPGGKVDLPVSVTTSVPENPLGPPLQWLIICLKEYHYAQAEAWFRHLISPTTGVLIVRNGINLKDDLLPFAQDSQLIEAMIDCPTQPIENGGYKQLKSATITVSSKAKIGGLNDVLVQAGIHTSIVDDFKTENWKKLIESSALGAILCLTGQTCHIFSNPDMQDTFLMLLDEGVEVAKADGAQLAPNFRDEMLTKLLTYPPEKGSSMLTDRLLGNQIEVNAKNGAIEQVGKKYKIKTPYNTLVSNLLSQVNQKTPS